MTVNEDTESTSADWLKLELELENFVYFDSAQDSEAEITNMFDLNENILELTGQDSFEDQVMEEVFKKEESVDDANNDILEIKKEFIEQTMKEEIVYDVQREDMIYIKNEYEENTFEDKAKQQVIQCAVKRNSIQNIVKETTVEENPSNYAEIVTKRSLPNINDPNFYCCVCKITFGGRYTYGIHLIHKHNIPDGIVFYQDAQSKYTELANMKVILYCPICDENFNNHTLYKYHLVTFHAKQSPLTGRSESNPYLMPDIYDAEFYCRTCQDRFNNKITYQYHLVCVHSMTHSTVFKEQKEINIAKMTCPCCQKIFENDIDYNHHQMKYRPGISKTERKRENNPEIKPDIYDPQFYCQSCNFTYKSKYRYHLHLKRKHNVMFIPPNVPDIIPDPKNELNYCCACDRKFSTKYSYRLHLKRIHNIQFDEIKQ